MRYGCGLYEHEWAMCPHKSWADKVEVANQKASTNVDKQVKNDGPSGCLICKELGHSTKSCPLYKEARKKAQVTTRRCYGCNGMGHLVDRCPNKQNKLRANQGHICYACRRKGHLSYDCPNGNIPKPNTFVNDNTSKLMCSSQSSVIAIWAPKHLLTNSKGPNKNWVPKCA
jgi:hypothetical protein